MNPFTVKTYSGPEYFFDRKQEIAKLSDAIFNGRNLTLFSHRRLGKTMLIRHCFAGLNKKMLQPVYVDLFATRNLAQFTQKLTEVLYEQHIIRDNKLKKLLGNLGATLTFNPLTGQPRINLGLSDRSVIMESLPGIFRSLAETGKNLVMALDEFQELAGYEEEIAEATIRTIMQDHPGITFIFSGSRKSLIKEMFTDPNRPFFQSTQMMELKEIDREVYAAEVFNVLRKHGKDFDKQCIYKLLDLTYCHTGFTHMVLSRVFSESESIIDDAVLEFVWSDILEDHKFLAREQEYLLTPLQWKTLLAIAREEFAKEPYSGDFIRKYGLSTPSSVSRSVRSLLEKGLIIDCGTAGLRIYNVFIQKNLQRIYG